MDLFEELRTVAVRQNQEGDFPDWLLSDVLAIADDPGKHGESLPLVETLIAQIRDYDPFAGTGCFDTSVGIEQIRATIRRLRP
uniref:Uncharacterized protein n=1 Tax=Geobacter metallireducens TaxID=28232 RepID=A0A831UC78_GEOME